MRKKQEHFTPSDVDLIPSILEIKSRTKGVASLSQMIDILLHQAVKERNRKKLASKKDNTEHNTSNPR